jgi:hypothetical protein
VRSGWPEVIASGMFLAVSLVDDNDTKMDLLHNKVER